MNKPTLVIGASTNPQRYAYLAVNALLSHGHTVFALGKDDGSINQIPIDHGFPEYSGVNTVTLYLRPQLQEQFYDYILKLKPARVVFNPGTENETFEKLLQDNGIEPVEACTLVMLSIGVY